MSDKMGTPDFRISDRLYAIDIVAFYQSQSVCLQDVAEDRAQPHRAARARPSAP
jgi:hypothetical protein